MKLCRDCGDPKFLCCDFCKSYDFNSREGGGYVGMGYCRMHKAYREPESEICDNYECEMGDGNE